MKTKMIRQFFLISLVWVSMILQGCAQNPQSNKKQEEVKYKVTFIELGSVRCIPCQKMQPIMKNIEEKYAGQVKVVFHDVWTPEGKPFATKYNITAIPTQVFLDENGKEYSRHTGYFPEEELIKVLEQKGVTEK